MLSKKEKVHLGLNVLRANLLGQAKGNNIVLSYPQGKKPYPISIQVRLTMKCNLACSYCHVYQSREPEVMKKEDYKALFSEMAEMGLRSVTFFGGEPLLYPDVGELVSYCKELGLVTGIVTNGWLVPQKFEEIKDIDIWGISLDGREELNDRDRGKGCYKRAIRAIEMVKNYGREVLIQTTVTKHNLQEVDFIINLAKEMGVKCNFQPFMTTHLIKEGAEGMRLSAMEHALLFSKLIEERRHGAPIWYPTSILRQFRRIRGPNNYHGGNKCFAGALYCVMDPNGDLFHCEGFVKRVKAPNALKLGFREAFNQMPEIRCTGCNFSCHIHKNIIYNLNPGAMLNAWQKV